MNRTVRVTKIVFRSSGPASLTRRQWRSLPILPADSWRPERKEPIIAPNAKGAGRGSKWRLRTEPHGRRASIKSCREKMTALAPAPLPIGSCNTLARPFADRSRQPRRCWPAAVVHTSYGLWSYAANASSTASAMDSKSRTVFENQNTSLDNGATSSLISTASWALT